MNDRSHTPLVIAHRGFSGRYPENTLAAVRAARDLAVDMIEVDVHETVDGELAVFHDYRLNRICGVPGRVRDVAWRALSQAGPAIPTFRQVLLACRGRVPLLIEIKRADPAKVVALIQRLNMTREVILFSLSRRIMEDLARVAPDIRRFGLLASWLPSRPADLSFPVEGLGVSRQLVTSRAVVDRVHRQGWRLFVWTVNRSSDMRRLTDWGVDGLITNHPDRAQHALLNR